MYSKENVTESSCIVNEMSLIMYVECCFVMGNICYSTSYNLPLSQFSQPGQG
jgi:hypothetical protein